MRARKISVRAMYLVDTNVVSKSRKRTRANAGVCDFFRRVAADQALVFKTGVRVLDPFS